MRYLNFSELAYVRHRASEIVRRRRPRRAGRVRGFVVPRPLALADLRPAVPLPVLRAVLDGLRRLEVA